MRARAASLLRRFGLALALAVAALLGAGRAEAITITFETVGGVSPTQDQPIPLNYLGFDFTASPTQYNGDMQFYTNGPGHSGSWAWLNDNRVGSDMLVTLHGGGTFSFTDLWVHDYDGGSITGQVIGKLAGAQVGSAIGFTANASWSHVTGNLAVVDTLVIRPVSPSNGVIEVDDLTVNSLVATVPEPASAALLALGAAGSLARGRRRGRPG